MSPNSTSGSVNAPVFVHTQGQVCAVYARNGRHLVTAGDDEFCYVLPLAQTTGELQTDASKVDVDVGAAVWCLDVSARHVAVGCDDHTVQLFKLGSGGSSLNEEGLVARCTLPVRALAFDRDGKRDMSLKVYNVDDTTEYVVASGHRKSVKAVAWSADGQRIAAAVCDGTICIYRLAPGSNGLASSPHSEKTVMGARDYVPEEGSASVSWHPERDLLAVAMKGGVGVLGGGAYITTHEFPNGVDGPLNHPVWSPSGRYLAAFAGDNHLIIWEWETKEEVARCSSLERPYTFAWDPVRNAITITNMQGEVQIWREPVPADKPASFGKAVMSTEVPIKATSDKGSTSKNPYIDDAAMDDERASETTAKSGKKRRENDMSEGGDDDDNDFADLDEFVVDDEDGHYRRPPMASSMRTARGNVFDSKPAYDFPALQPAFQPSSTPMRGTRRYLALNMVGSITSISQNTHFTVDIEFHDTASRRPIHFKDHFGFTMGVLTEGGALFAATSAASANADGTLASTTASVLFYKAFESWASGGDWTVYLPEDETITAIAMGDKWVVATTSQGNVRVFTRSGIQSYVFSVCGGPVVALAGCDELLFVVKYSAPHPGSRLEYDIYDMNDQFPCIENAVLPLTPNTTLAWIGFSELGMPASYDSAGVLRGCFRNDGHRWIPLLDTRPLVQGKQDYYWPVSISDDVFLMVICKAGEKHPPFPKAIISEVPLKLPTVNGETAVGAQEEQYLRKLMLYRQLRDLPPTGDAELDATREKDLLKMQSQMDKILLALIHQACKTERPMRALELCTMVYMEKTLQLAYQLANASHAPSLAHRIELVRQAKFGDGVAVVAQRPRVVEKPRSVARPVKKPIALMPSMAAVAPVAMSHDEESKDERVTAIVEEAPKTKFNPFKKTAPTTGAQKKVVSAMDAADVVAERREEKRTAAQSAAAESEAAAAKKRKTTQKTLSFAKKQVALKEEDSVVVDDDVTSENVETQVEPVKVKLDDPLAKDIFGDDEEEGADVLVEDRTYAVEDKENVVMAASPTLLPPSTAASKLEKFKLVAKNAEAPTATDDDHTVSEITPVEVAAPDTAAIDMELA